MTWIVSVIFTWVRGQHCNRHHMVHGFTFIYVLTTIHRKDSNPPEKCIRCEVICDLPITRNSLSTINQTTDTTHSWNSLSDGGIKLQHSNLIYLNYYSRYHTHTYFQFTTHDVFLELPSWSTLKVKSLKSQIIASLIYIKVYKHDIIYGYI